MRRLFQFHGGVHLKEHKKDAMVQPVQIAHLPKQLVLPLQQHIGAPAEAIVAAGDKVLKGQLIARPGSNISAPVHASSSGTVIAIAEHPVSHPSHLDAPCIIIDTDGEDRWHTDRQPVDNYHELPPEKIREHIRDAGIVGMGGAGFPAHIKLNPADHVVDTLILNGAECEPYITCDEMLLRERALEVIVGLRIMRYALQAKRCIIGVENNKAAAFRALQEQVRNTGADFIEVIQVPTVYPTGGEKQLIRVLTGKEVPASGLPLNIGVVCHNVGTAYAVYRAIELGEPLVSRYVTVAGSVAHARNLEVLIGTPVIDLIEECGGNHNTLSRVILGGPMMGTALHNITAPVTKTTNCILVNSTVGDVPLPSRDNHAMPCIRCGDCAISCPIDLLPQQLYWYARAKDFDKVQDYHLFDCIECGCCDYVCPSQIPLVHYFRYAKTEIWTQQREKTQADIARERHEFREQRLERDKREKQERHKKKRAALKPAGSAANKEEETKKAAIQAAMDRARAKRESQQIEPKNTRDLTPEQQQKIDEADARRAKSNSSTVNARINGAMDKQDAQQDLFQDNNP
ncbi:MAG: electron transport complex subunit RsxC [Gammaproteobacteria bacterium]|nr:electron transport complex subunit RsxC [Gammaproteobacteria bacterium]